MKLKPAFRTAVFVAIATVVSACATTTSSTGRTQYVGGVSEQQLQQLGEQAFAEARAKGSLSNNTAHNTYVRCVVNALVAQLPAQSRATGWDTAVFAAAEPNAFALPGGKIGINTGIFTVARNQDQLAAVLAHEIGHVIENHHNERITRQMGAQTGVGLFGALLGSRYGQGAADATSQFGGMAAQGLFLLPNSRVQESEADVVGQRLMAQAGFDPAQAVNLWQNMIAHGGSRQPEWLSTHPDPQVRIQDLRERASALAPVYQQARAAGRAPRCA